MIREATQQDRPRLEEMARNFLRLTPYGEIMGPTVVAGLIDLVFELGVILVCDRAKLVSGRGAPAIIDGNGNHPPIGVESQLVGMLAVVDIESPMTGARYADEIAWWVEPDARGSIGRRLHDAGEAWARARGLPAIHMKAPFGTDLGVYYRRLGYREVETTYMKLLD